MAAGGSDVAKQILSRGGRDPAEQVARETPITNAIGRAKAVGGRASDASPAQGSGLAGGYDPQPVPPAGGLGGVVYKPNPEVAKIWQEGGISAPDFVQSSPEEFKQALHEAKTQSPFGAAVTEYPDYSGMKTFTTPDKSAGFALN
jgi:hypothetical protein